MTNGEICRKFAEIGDKELEKDLEKRLESMDDAEVRATNTKLWMLAKELLIRAGEQMDMIDGMNAALNRLEAKVDVILEKES